MYSQNSACTYGFLLVLYVTSSRRHFSIWSPLIQIAYPDGKRYKTIVSVILIANAIEPIIFVYPDDKQYKTKPFVCNSNGK